MPSQHLRRHVCLLALTVLPLTANAEDLHVKKNLSIDGNPVSTSETLIKGARERTVTQSSSGVKVTLRQCDLKRSITINDQLQTYLVTEDPQLETPPKATVRKGLKAARASETREDEAKILVITTVTDTGERKEMFGYPARHLKITVTRESSPTACSKVSQKYEMDGWYADLSKELAGCSRITVPIQQGEGCHDRVVSRVVGAVTAGFPLAETTTLRNEKSGEFRLDIATAEITKQPLDSALFDIPQGYREVASLAELNGTLPAPQQASRPAMAQAGTSPQSMPPQGAAAPAAMNPMQPLAMGMQGQSQAAYPVPAGNSQAMAQPAMYGTGNPSAAQNMARGGNPMAMMQQMMGGGGVQGMGQQPGPAAAPVAVPQQLGPKAPGKIRIGVAPPDAQVGQGSNTGQDYSTPIRNSIVLLMSGPAVEIAALDSHIPMQLQAEAQQKQCDFVMFSAVSVKHGSGGGFGKFMKMGSMAASMTPIGAMGKGMGGAVAAQAASAAASAAAMSAQQQAMNQLAGFNQQIKLKDDVTVQYSLVQTGQATARLQNQLQGKAKGDGEDVLTPLLQQAANAVLTEAAKK